MDIAHEITERARRANRRVVFPEGGDPRIQQAASQLAADRLQDRTLDRGQGTRLFGDIYHWLEY